MLEAGGDATGEEWALRVITFFLLLVVAFIGKWALTLPRKSEVDTQIELNRELRKELREEQGKREKLLQRENKLERRILKLEILLERCGGTVPLDEEEETDPE